MREKESSSSSSSIGTLVLHLLLLLLLWRIEWSNGQQSYVNNKQLQCEQNYTTTLGYVCNGAASSCLSYLTFRSNPIYSSPATIGYLLGSDPSEIARINNITDVGSVPSDTLLIVPVNCSCFSSSYYQHNTSYVLKTSSETYFSVANNTYGGLTTCQAMIAQNPYNFRDLVVGMKLTIPLRCACPTTNQTAAGIKYLVSYLITWGNTLSFISNAFGGVDVQAILDANELSADSIIYPFTPILVPLKSEPTKIDATTSSVSPPPPPPPSPPVGTDNKTSKQWVIVGPGVGAAVLLLAAASVFLICLFRRRRLRPLQGKSDPSVGKKLDDDFSPADYNPILSGSKSWLVSPEGIRHAVGARGGTLAVYGFEELQTATGFFGEDNRIKGSVYLGRFDGDLAAVKVVNGDVSNTEISILQQLNHSHIIRLSGFCFHEANTFLVYEYAENGSLSDWLHPPLSDDPSKKSVNQRTEKMKMSWKQRIHVAYDVADALNYLHNYSNPTCIHKNLKSSNILLDSNLRAKIANFGLARSLENQSQNHGDEEPPMQMTRHVVGTHGYMAPEYIENGLITSKMDIFAFGVVMLELLSGREALDLEAKEGGGEEESCLLSARIDEVMGGENVREKLQGFMDPCLKRGEYPLELVYSLAQLARSCVARNPNSRPTMPQVLMTLSKILSSSLDWDPPEDQSDSFQF